MCLIWGSHNAEDLGHFKANNQTFWLCELCWAPPPTLYPIHLNTSMPAAPRGHNDTVDLSAMYPVHWWMSLTLIAVVVYLCPAISLSGFRFWVMLGVGLQWQTARLFSGNPARQGVVPFPLSPYPVLRSDDHTVYTLHSSSWPGIRLAVHTVINQLEQTPPQNTHTPLLLNTHSSDGWLCFQRPFPQL